MSNYFSQCDAALAGALGLQTFLWKNNKQSQERKDMMAIHAFQFVNYQDFYCNLNPSVL